jgi:hypothetical protein
VGGSTSYTRLRDQGGLPRAQGQRVSRRGVRPAAASGGRRAAPVDRNARGSRYLQAGLGARQLLGKSSSATSGACWSRCRISTRPTSHAGRPGAGSRPCIVRCGRIVAGQDSFQRNHRRRGGHDRQLGSIFGSAGQVGCAEDCFAIFNNWRRHGPTAMHTGTVSRAEGLLPAPNGFKAFFELATGVGPYPYQRRLTVGAR